MRATLRALPLSSLSSTDVAVVGAAQTRPLAVLLVVLELPTADITVVGCTVWVPVRSCCAADVFARPVLSRRTHSSPGHATLLCTRIAGTRGSNAQCVSIMY